MDAIMHIFGMCGDAHTHLDLLDLFLAGGSLGMATVYVKYNWRRFKTFINGKFKRTITGSR